MSINYNPTNEPTTDLSESPNKVGKLHAVSQRGNDSTADCDF